MVPGKIPIPRRDPVSGRNERGRVILIPEKFSQFTLFKYIYISRCGKDSSYQHHNPQFLNTITENLENE